MQSAKLKTLFFSEISNNLILKTHFNYILTKNIKQVNLVYILRRTKQNLKHATPIQKKINIR